MVFLKAYGGSIKPQKEEYYRKKQKTRNTKDAFFTILKCLLVIIAILLVIFILYIWELIVKQKLNNYLLLNNIKSLSESLFNIQATISTLTIAIISIFSGFMKEKVFGQSIIKYILFKKNYPITIYNISIFLILLILVSAFFILIQGYSICLLLFVLTVLGIIYITKESFKLLSDYDKIVSNIKDNTLQELNKNFNMLNYIDTEEENIEYILEENYNLKSFHTKIENCLINLYDDTIKKVNEGNFNSYCINVNMFINILEDSFDFINMNRLKENIYTTLIQEIEELFYTLMKQKQYNLAIDILLTLNSTMDRILQERNLSNKDKKNVKNFFNLYECINYFLETLSTQYRYNKEHLDAIKWIIFVQNYYYLNHIEIDIYENYDEDRVYKCIFELLFKLYKSVNENKFYTRQEKETIEKFFMAFKDEYNKPNTWWGSFLDYRMFVRRRNNKITISKEGKLVEEDLPMDIDKEMYNKVVSAVDNIKNRLLKDFNIIIDKGILK